MKPSSLLLITALLLFSVVPARSQKLHYCDSSISYWICDSSEPAFILELNGPVQTVSQEKQEAIFIGPYMFMFELYGKYDFLDRKTIRRLEKEASEDVTRNEAELLMQFVQNKPSPGALSDFTIQKAPASE